MKLCPLRMTTMPSKHLKSYREQYECLGEDCMWYEKAHSLTNPTDEDRCAINAWAGGSDDE